MAEDSPDESMDTLPPPETGAMAKDSPDESMDTLPPPGTGDRDEDSPDPAESDSTEEPMDTSP